MNTYQQVIILSGELADKTYESNRQRSQNLEVCLQELGISYRQALGVYKDIQELSFITLPKNEAEIDTLKNFAFENFGQESVLYQDGNGQAWLLYNDGLEENISFINF